MLVFAVSISLSAACLAILVNALRKAPEAFEDEKGLHIVRGPVATAGRSVKRSRPVAVSFRRGVKTA